MISYIARDKTNGATIQGGLNACLYWASQRVANYPKSVIAIIKLRPGEDGRVIGEIDRTGGHWIFGGRHVPKRDIAKFIQQVKAHG